VWATQAELGTKVTCTLASPTHRSPRPHQPSDDWTFGDLAEPHVADRHGDDGNLDWDGESTGLDADAGAALPETWMQAGAAALRAGLLSGLDAGLRAVDAQRVTTVFEEVRAVVNRVQDVPDLMRDLCEMLQCAWMATTFQRPPCVFFNTQHRP
jgi:hypothetical protein